MKTERSLNILLLVLLTNSNLQLSWHFPLRTARRWKLVFVQLADPGSTKWEVLPGSDRGESS